MALQKLLFNNQGQSLVGIIIVLVIVGLIGGGLYVYLSKQISEIPEITEKTEVGPKEEIAKPSPEKETVPAEKIKKTLGQVSCMREETKSGVTCGGTFYADYCENLADGTGYANARQCNTSTGSSCSSLLTGDRIFCSYGCQGGICLSGPSEEVIPKPEKPVIQKCTDGVLYGECSTNKPKYCDSGNLINNCSICGCPSGQTCDADENCISPSFVQCSSGVCCDTLTNTFRPSTYKCETNISSEHGCPWGSSPGSDVGVRYQDKYCSGASASCGGASVWSGWSVHNDCASNKSCINGFCVPLSCSDGTPYNQCSTNKPKYCENGELLDKASLCGCPVNYEPDGNGCVKTFSAAEEYFFDIAFDVEYGSASELHKWITNVKIKTYGTPTNADMDTLNQIIVELNNLIGGSITLSLTEDSNISNVEMHFVPEPEFATIEPNYAPINYGYFWVWWYGTGDIYNTRILIASEEITQQERSHLIREELTQALGLFQDSWLYPESIFYQGWTDTTEYASIDRSVISLLYDSRLLPDMTKEQAQNILAGN